MEAGQAKRIAPVLVLSTGRCGSTMVSEVLNTHPDVLSLSEFFISLGMKSLLRKRLSGKALWGICCRHSPGLRAMLGGNRDRILYPFGTRQARYTTRDIPSILCVVLPHLTSDYEGLFEELQPVVRRRPRSSLPEQYQFLFDWLCGRLGRRVWVERSGGSLLFGRRLMGLFPRARVVHIYRDGRDTALSMSKHPAFKAGPALMSRLQRMGVDPYGGDPIPNINPLTLLRFRFVNMKRMMRHGAALEAYGELWSRMIMSSREYLSLLPPDQFLALRYEDVLQHPREKLQELVAFIDPSLVDDAWLDLAAHIPRPNPSRFSSLDKEARQRLTEACAPGLEALGYEA
ncbi:MAG: sulfotransferase domain-containing protein [Candidatus Tectomicrobia bacterium]|nr:sulfotransferase domain-containing protein [Candidatus Tectomicrobia bacterium]